MARIIDAGLVYCIDYLDSNLDWLQEKLELIQKSRGLQSRRHCCCFAFNKVVCIHRQYHICAV